MKSNGYFVNCKHFKKNSNGGDCYIINYILINSDGSVDCFMSFVDENVYNKVVSLKYKALRPTTFVFGVSQNLKAKLIDVE